MVNAGIDINELLKRLELYTNIDSNSYCKADVDRLSHVIENECRQIGLHVIRHQQDVVGDFLEFTAGDGKKKILLLGHMDTVFPVGTAAKQPFRCDGNRVCGPGVLDMKGGLSIILQVVKQIAACIPSGCRVTVFLNSDEETGSRYSKEYIIEHAKSSEVVLSFEGAKPGTLTTERKGIISFDIEIAGIAAHSGVNYMLGSSAIESAAIKIRQLYTLRDDKKEMTVNVGRINGGITRNIVAPFAKIEGEIRYFAHEDRPAILSRLSEIVKAVDVCHTSAEVHIVSDRPPLVANEGCIRLFEIARQEAEILGKKLRPNKTGGGGDAAFAGTCKIPVIDGLGPEGENSHSDNEYILADSLHFKAELAARIIQKIMQGVVL